MVGRIDIDGDRVLQATVLSIRAAPREIRKEIRQHTRRVAQAEFTKQVAERAVMAKQPRAVHAVIARTARVTVSDQNVKMSAATQSRPLKGGLVPLRYGTAFEFGSNKREKVEYQRRASKRSGAKKSRRGAGMVHTVRRNTHAQLPAFHSKGWAFYPTVTDMIPRIVRLWSQTAVRTLMESIEKGSR